MWVRVEHHPDGPRLFVGPVRSQHYAWGIAFIAWGSRWVWKDRHDLFKALAAAGLTNPLHRGRRTAMGRNAAAAFDPEIGVTTSVDGSW